MNPRDFLEGSGETHAQDELPGRDFLSESKPPAEGLGTALLKSPFRIGEDLYKSGYALVKNMPETLEKAKTAIPEAFQAMQGNALGNNPNANPTNALKQGVAGLTEGGHELLNTPYNTAQYAANRLNLLPLSIADKIPKQQDISSDVDYTFGEAKTPGEKLIRGVGRNAVNVLGASKIAGLPGRLTDSGIARNVVAEQGRQQAAHTRQYNGLWHAADRAGINQVQFDPHLVDTNLNFIERYKAPREYESVNNFRQHPTLENAQRAQSDLGAMRRSLEEKSKSQSLTSEERHLLDAVTQTERHIEGNMFRDPRTGQINQPLQNQYNAISHSYRENVVPYRYNKDIQNYIDRKLTAKELVQRLNHGEFAVKKGRKHPAIAINKAIFPASLIVGGGVSGKYLWDKASGNNTHK